MTSDYASWIIRVADGFVRVAVHATPSAEGVSRYNFSLRAAVERLPPEVEASSLAQTFDTPDAAYEAAVTMLTHAYADMERFDTGGDPLAAIRAATTYRTDDPRPPLYRSVLDVWVHEAIAQRVLVRVREGLTRAQDVRVLVLAWAPLTVAEIAGFDEDFDPKACVAPLPLDLLLTLGQQESPLSDLYKAEVLVRRGVVRGWTFERAGRYEAKVSLQRDEGKVLN